MNRIELLASLTKGYHTICDIGCDHGYVLIKALEEYDVSYAYALDINQKPLEMARNNVFNRNLASKVSFLISDGLKNFNHDFDLAIISGMGGLLIKKIISESLAKFKDKDLLLSPQGDSDKLRMFLFLNGYKIKYENAIYDKGKYYEIILFTKGFKNYNYFDLTYGPLLIETRNEIALKHYDKLLKIKNKAYIESNKEELKDDIISLSYFVEDKMEKIYYYKENYYMKMFIDDSIRDLIIIFPGGGYNHTSPREAENIGIKYNALGYNVLVFHYRETLDDYKTLYKSISEAINNLDKTNIKNIYLNGYSAGGHLALELANHQKLYNLNIKGLILCYPVVSTKEDAIHEGSFKYLLNGDRNLYARYSEELEVNKETPKVFLWHTFSDEAVPIYNSLYLLEALKKNNINFEAHIFPMGHHGLGLASKDSARDSNDIIPYVSRWFEFLKEWLKLNEE